MLFDRMDITSTGGGRDTSSFKRSASYQRAGVSSCEDQTEQKDDCSIEMGSVGQPEGEASDIWGWVRKYDELTSAMKSGAVLYGFIEAPITFPPSFKWKKGCHAADFTDLDLLAGRNFLRVLLK